MGTGGLVNTEQCKRIIENYLGHSGRGGFCTGVVKSTEPLVINVDSRYDVSAECIYVTDSCIGLVMHFRHEHGNGGFEKLQNDVIVRRPLQAGDGVLLLCRPDSLDKTQFILLDRIQPYILLREVDAR